LDNKSTYILSTNHFCLYFSEERQEEVRREIREMSNAKLKPNFKRREGEGR